MKRIVLPVLGLILVASIAVFMAMGRQGDSPCAEPSELPVPRERVVRCAERYVEEQWYTTHWGRFGSLEADSHGDTSWWELMLKHRGTLQPTISALCTHPRDLKGALGHLALFEPAAKNHECQVVSVTPMLGTSVKDQTCEAVRAQSACVGRDEALKSTP